MSDQMERLPHALLIIEQALNDIAHGVGRVAAALEVLQEGRHD